MKASRSVVSLCRVPLAVVVFATELAAAGCGSDTGVPATTPAQVQASPEVAVKGKAKGKAKVDTTSRRDLYRAKAQAAKDSQ